MSAQIIDGKAVSTSLRQAIKAETAQLAAAGTTPGLAVILVGDDPA
ncbi:MAG: bifunctional 5,10-methylene-tetrahydrofolate dehydrogenase/5,10-methylene-tetrahydrofolate cyclohydrolase, partial [Oscillospiraceae bacterium]|nr:bifunctional 5,10-methylene-tetrahydrofolate dehydrogenase/5,10-methylene-tetrahydrofolate cyclohydrolase [Oscillospiraceae bacterium]